MRLRFTKGGTVTQATSKSTGVTLDRICGQITMHNASLAAATTVSFTLTNSRIAASDIPVVAISSGGTSGAYTVTVTAIAAGSCVISVRNETAGALGEALVLNFGIIKMFTA
jgi:hypothetical protein